MSDGIDEALLGIAVILVQNVDSSGSPLAAARLTTKSERYDDFQHRLYEAVNPIAIMCRNGIASGV